MLVRRTIGISLAFLVISTGAMAKSPDKPASHHPDQARCSKPQQASQQTGKSHGSSSSRARSAHHGVALRHHHEPPDVAAHDGAPDPVAMLGGREFGKAAWYNHVGSPTSSGERLDAVTATAAHRTLPLASYARVTNLDSGRSVIVRINDRGPWTRRFIIDLSPRAADELNMRHAGVASVAVEPIASPVKDGAASVATFRNSHAYVTQ